MHRKALAGALCIVFLVQGTVRAQLRLEEPIDRLVRTGIDLTFQQRYEEADSVFAAVIHQFPDSPAGYVYRAGAYQSRCLEGKLEMKTPLFDTLLSRALDASEGMIGKSPESPWGYFFLGTTLGYDSYARVQNGDWLGGTMKGIASVGEFRRAIEKDSSLVDAYVGIGTYMYWRSRKTEFLHWLPFVSDEREPGRVLIQRTINAGVYNRLTALGVLAAIELDAGRFKVAKELADRGLSLYPRNRTFLWECAEAELKSGDFRAARRTYERLLSVLKNGKEENVYNELVCLLNLARACSGEGDTSQALIHVQEALALADRGFPPHLRARGNEKVKGVRELVNALRPDPTLSKEQ